VVNAREGPLAGDPMVEGLEPQGSFGVRVLWHWGDRVAVKVLILIGK